jgi:gas vesicle protein
MREDNSYSGAHVLLAFVAGAVTGAAVALLTAPQSGSETRGDLRGWAREGQAGVSRLPETLTTAYHRAVDAAKRTFNRELRERTAADVSESSEPREG